MKLKTEEVAAMIAEIRKTQRACEILNNSLQALCPHEEYVEGLSIVACIHPVLLCKTCGHCKPLEGRVRGFDPFDYEIPPQD